MLAFSSISFAQVDVGAGAQVDFPMMFNPNVGSYHHSLGAIGPRLNFKYYPRNASFYPSVHVNGTGIKLPVVKDGTTIVNMLFRQVNLVVGANLRKVFENKRELHYGLGIGVSFLDAYGLELNEKSASGAMSFGVDSGYAITRIAPAVTPSIEYLFPISQEKPLFVGIGGQLQYIYFFDDGNSSTVQVVDAQGQYLKLKAALRGHMVNPGLQLSVYWRFGNNADY
jgi:hypothetical protein